MLVNLSVGLIALIVLSLRAKRVRSAAGARERVVATHVADHRRSFSGGCCWCCTAGVRRRRAAPGLYCHRVIHLLRAYSLMPMIQSCRDCRALGPATAAPHSGELRAARRKVETSRKKGGAVGTTANGARRAPGPAAAIMANSPETFK